MSALRVGEETAKGRRERAHTEMLAAGKAYSLCKQHLDDFERSARFLVQDENVERRRQELIAERNRAWDALQEARAIVNFMIWSVPPKQFR